MNDSRMEELKRFRQRCRLAQLQEQTDESVTAYLRAQRLVKDMFSTVLKETHPRMFPKPNLEQTIAEKEGDGRFPTAAPWMFDVMSEFAGLMCIFGYGTFLPGNRLKLPQTIETYYRQRFGERIVVTLEYEQEKRWVKFVPYDKQSENEFARILTFDADGFLDLPPEFASYIAIVEEDVFLYVYEHGIIIETGYGF